MPKGDNDNKFSGVRHLDHCSRGIGICQGSSVYAYSCRNACIYRGHSTRMYHAQGTCRTYAGVRSRGLHQAGGACSRLIFGRSAGQNLSAFSDFQLCILRSLRCVRDISPLLVLCYLTGGQIARGDSTVVAHAENSRIRFCLLVLVFYTLRVSVLQSRGRGYGSRMCTQSCQNADISCGYSTWMHHAHGTCQSKSGNSSRDLHQAWIAGRLSI